MRISVGSEGEGLLSPLRAWVCMELSGRIREVCRSHLAGQWAHATDEQIILQVLLC